GFMGKKNLSGGFWEEAGRNILAEPGQRVVLREGASPKSPQKITESIGSAGDIMASYKQNDWNDLVIIAAGNRLQHYLNGKLVVDVTDETAAAAKTGTLALQIKAGPLMQVWFKNLRIKKLAPDGQPDAAPGNAFDKELASLPPDQQVARVVAKLKELNPSFDGKETHKVEGGAVTELAISTTGVTDITPVKALKWLKKLTVAPWAMNQKGSLADLSPLKELPLSWLYCQGNPISDLSPLRNMPLTVLSCGGTQVSDLSPLAGMKLAVLSVNDTAVSDLSPLSGMPLTTLWCNNTKVTDLAPLRSLPLQELRCDFQPPRDAEALRGVPTLRKINDQMAAVLLRQSAASTASPRSSSADGFQPLFNGRDLAGWTPIRTTGADDEEHRPAAGGWITRNGELVCVTDQSGWLRSERQYGNFVLQLEFKLRSDSNSGVYVRSPAEGHLSRVGTEIQIIDPNYKGRAARFTSDKVTGAIYSVVGMSRPPLRPMGEWNSMEIRCDGDNIEVTLNGTRTAAANASREPAMRDRPRSGYIGISNWHGEAKGVAFRNIRIKDLSAKPAGR
ncbi:MAG: DUF1080 domain-containing protein, partial [Verrucomicrobia bacterium]|nr:DUF1080 domain-containing protein [Verrucomicrobiota bacterium]